MCACVCVLGIVCRLGSIPHTHASVRVRTRASNRCCLCVACVVPSFARLVDISLCSVVIHLFTADVAKKAKGRTKVFQIGVTRSSTFFATSTAFVLGCAGRLSCMARPWLCSRQHSCVFRTIGLPCTLGCCTSTTFVLGYTAGVSQLMLKISGALHYSLSSQSNYVSPHGRC